MRRAGLDLRCCAEKAQLEGIQPGGLAEISRWRKPPDLHQNINQAPPGAG